MPPVHWRPGRPQATTTGQGQAPRQPGEQVVANVGSVYGLVFIGLLSGIVGRAMLQVGAGG